MRNCLPSAMAFAVLVQGGIALAQTATDPIDPTISQDERICEVEIAEIEAMRADAEGELEPMQEAQLDRLMAEARDFCERDNGVMAAIRLEAARAMIEVVRPPAPPGGEVPPQIVPAD